MDGDFTTPLLLALEAGREPIVLLLARSRHGLEQQSVQTAGWGPGSVLDYCKDKTPELLPTLKEILRQEEEETGQTEPRETKKGDVGFRTVRESRRSVGS